MDSSSPTSLLLPSPMLQQQQQQQQQIFMKPNNSTTTLTTNGAGACGVVFDSSLLRKQVNIPKEFIWPLADCPAAIEELDAPIVDISGFLNGNVTATERAVEAIASACSVHGFFQVTGHGVEPSLIGDAMACMDEFFLLPLSQKLRARRIPGSMWGYAGAHADRFSSQLPWKETLSFGYNASGDDDDNNNRSAVVDYFSSTLGEDYIHMGLVYERYCKKMNDLSLAIMELLAMSLGLQQRQYYRNFFTDSSSIMRCNYYPPCQEPELTLGTGPHCDPTAVTILQQDQVDGLEVFSGDRWRSVRPVTGAMVINIGDTFMALSNGRYKSCLHRAVVNRHRERRSLAFFLCPKENKIISPPPELVAVDGFQRYPDFTWSQMVEFTQKHYRADVKTLQSFAHWLRLSSSNSCNKI